jgi:hypothetical protein
MPEDYEDLMRVGLLEPPAGFSERVMAEIERSPIPDFSYRSDRRRERVEFLTLIGAGLLGAAQLAAFMFGIWTATSAG